MEDIKLFIEVEPTRVTSRYDTRSVTICKNYDGDHNVVLRTDKLDDSKPPFTIRVEDGVQTIVLCLSLNAIASIAEMWSIIKVRPLDTPVRPLPPKTKKKKK